MDGAKMVARRHNPIAAGECQAGIPRNRMGAEIISEVGVSRNQDRRLDESVFRVIRVPKFMASALFHLENEA
jgi:hypothetical protein